MNREQLNLGVKYGHIGKSMLEIEIEKGLVSRSEELNRESR